MSSESQFFSSVATSINPGWKAQVNDALAPGELNLAACTVKLYALDIKEGHIWAGAMQPQNLATVLQKAASQGFSCTNFGHVLKPILDQARRGAAEKRIEQQIIQGTATLLVGTATLDLVRQKQPDLSGHWVVLLYQARNGELINRIAYISNSQAGGQMLDPEHLHFIVSQVMKADRDPSTNVAKQLKECGGVDVSARFA